MTTTNVDGVTTNAEDYNYFNPLPGATPGAEAKGTVPEIVVITPPAGGQYPFRADNGISPMEAGMFDVNPAYNPATQPYLQNEDEGEVSINEPSIDQEAALGPEDQANQNPVTIEDAGDNGPDVLPTPQG